jgi:putative flavoprotein involved in K+ transport
MPAAGSLYRKVLSGPFPWMGARVSRPNASIERIDTLVVGAGQAGLATSYHLTRGNEDHLVLEQASIGETWRSKRWDSFTLATPNATLQLPGFEYGGDDPDGFLDREEVVSYLQNYATSFGAPVRCGFRVEALDHSESSRFARYRLRTNSQVYAADNVVIASGGFFTPRIPGFSKELPKDIVQLTPDSYRNPGALPDGAVLVVGSAQSGAQVAEELLYEGEHPVYLALGSAGRLPRRYRHKDCSWWMMQMARVKGLRTVHDLPTPAAKFAANPHVSGKDGGHEINLRHLRRDGAVLLGHMLAANSERLSFAPDVEISLSKADEFAAAFKRSVDELIDLMGWEMPPERPIGVAEHAFDYGPPIEELDMNTAGITSVIWATGYRPDFSFVKLPIFDAEGYPIQSRGVTNYPGLYFVGLPWLYTAASGLLAGVGEDAGHVARALIGARAH